MFQFTGTECVGEIDMPMLDRYRKKNGFAQLLQLIEGSHTQKREQFLSLIREESPVWEAELRKRILTFERLTKWNPQYLSEIFTRVQPLTLAVAYYEYPPDSLKAAFSQLSPTLVKKIEITQSEVKPTAADRFTCQIKIIEEARSLFKQGTLQLVKVDEELFIPNQIEEIISEREKEELINDRIHAVSAEIEQNRSASISLVPSLSQSVGDDAPPVAKTAVQAPVSVVTPVASGNANAPAEMKVADAVNSAPEESVELDPKKLSSEVFLKQINQEMVNLKKRVEKFSTENHNLSEETARAKVHEVKLKDEIIQLRREVQALKNDNMLMKSKLDQIKKIA